MNKALGLAAAAVMSAGALSGCGGSGDYCSSLEDTVEEFESFDEGDVEQFDGAIESFRDLGDQAPSEIEEEWDTFTGGFDSVESALDDVGADFGDLQGIQTGEIPEGVDEEELMGALESIQELDSQEFQDASDAIEEHAESECDVSLSE